MLPAKHRLRRDRDITRVRRSSYGAQDPLWRVQVERHMTVYASARVAVVVSKKVSSKAVERNRLTRRVRAWAASILPLLPPQTNILIVARKPFPDYHRNACKTDLRILCTQLRLLPPQ